MTVKLQELKGWADRLVRDELRMHTCEWRCENTLGVSAHAISYTAIVMTSLTRSNVLKAKLK